MRLRVLVLALATAALAQTENQARSARAPQGQIRYDDPDGSKVNWKFYAPYNQWRTHLENPQRAQRAETGTSQPQIPAAHQLQQQQQQQQQHQTRLAQSHQPAAVPNAVPSQSEYKPYSSVPSHIKQLISQTYEPQRPYVDPSSFLYEASLPAQQAISPVDRSRSSQYESPAARYQTIEDTKTAPTAYYSDREAKPQGRIDYKEDYEQQAQQQEQEQQQQQQEQVPGILVPIETMPVQPPPKLVIDKNMPQEIQQLLHYQAHIPYDVIANRITYRPKSLFIPKPISEDSKGPYFYKSKIYFMKDDNIDDVEDAKLLEESRSH